MAIQKLTTSTGTQYEFIKDPSRVEEIAKRIRSEATSTGYDLETTGVDPHRDKVLLASLTTRQHGTFVIDARDPRVLPAMRELLEDDKITKLTHNGGFDYQMTKGNSGVNVEGIRDTMLGEQCLTQGLQWDGYGLDDLMSKYLDISMDKSTRKSFIGFQGGEFSLEQLDYTADDTARMPDLANIIQEKCKEKGVLKAWRIESDAIQAFADMEFYGQKIDAEKWKEVIDDNLKRAEEARHELNEFFRPVCDVNLFGEVVINYDSQPDLLYRLQCLGVSVDGQVIRDTSKKTQKKIQHLPIMKALARYRGAIKGAGTYGMQYINAIHPVTGRVHFRFNQYGTETGRPACRGGLNCLNIPRDLKYRHSFITDPDRLISTVDYSGAELRIMADLSGDPLMVEGFNSGVDFHCFVASMLFGVEVTKKNENAHLRTPTKSLNFGLAYGMSPFSLYELLNGTGYKISLEECKDLFNRYKNTFKTTIHWLQSRQHTALQKLEMSNSNGRMRHWTKPNFPRILAQIEAENAKRKKGPKMTPGQIQEAARDKYKAAEGGIKREGANFMIQSINADMTKTAMARIRKEFQKRNWDGRMYNSVYDEIVMDLHKDIAQEGYALQEKIMLESANEMLKRVPMEVEGHLTTTWTK